MKKTDTFPVVIVAGLLLLPSLAVAMTVYISVWWAVRPALPRAPVLTEADFAAAQPVDPEALTAPIRTVIAGQFQIAGPVRVTSGTVSRGTVVVSVPVTFSEEATVDEDATYGAYSVTKGSVFHKQIFQAVENHQPVQLTAWCGPVAHGGLFHTTEVMCLEQRRASDTGDEVGIFPSYDGSSTPAPAKYYANAVGTEDWLDAKSHYPFPKMTPVVASSNVMTLELEADGGRIMGLRWELLRPGASFPVWLFADGEFGPNWAVASGTHYVYPLGDRALAFDYDLSTKKITMLGMVAPAR